ncbi:hypothetical protein BDN70DRAFT_276837 [Pholiota conissans]|uniref:Uncharacterized protein n=1 Tax=Pholiota conissans TaxID=109636 RepID=A0A9P6CX41_9AGAR|nr:hypothetical protein BDN70DRAFT_276837 [Pholiota conissans]
MPHLELVGKQYRVVLTPLERLPPNPHIGPPEDALRRALAPPPPEVETDEDGENRTKSRLDKILFYRLLAYDQRSLLTGSAAADLQISHIINPIRRNEHRKRDVVSSALSRPWLFINKRANFIQETFLSQQCFQNPGLYRFELGTSTENMILLEASLHIQWSRYGTFCFVPAEKDALEMLAALRASNASWTKNCNTGPFGDSNTPRRLKISDPPYSTPLWDVVLLYPDALLPEGQTLAIAQDRFLYGPGQPECSAPQQTWTYWIASGDQLVSNSPPHEPLAPFLAKSMRSEYQTGHFPSFSSFAMIVNAHSKLQQFVKDNDSHVSPRVQRYVNLISNLVYEIFFVPEGYPSAAEPCNTLEWAIRIDNENASTSLSKEHATDAAKVPNKDGLTDAEFQKITKSANDPSLEPGERAKAAMSMIFGTHRYEDPYSHGSPLIKRD